MKTWTETIGDAEVTIVAERLPLQSGRPYTQRITAEFAGHKLSHSVTHDPSNFSPGDAKTELNRIGKILALRVVGMANVKNFLDEFHAQ